MSDSREQLKSRVLPQITLSNASNPLTAPLPHDSTQSMASKAIDRFAIRGNAIITGGAGNLGIEAARGLLEHGCVSISLFDLRSSISSSASAIEALKQDFPTSKIIAEDVDVTDEQNVQDAVQRTAKAFGGVDILLCFAGIVNCVHAEEMNSQDWRRVLEINTTGSWLCAQSVGKQMISQGRGGSIVFTASISAHRVNFPQPQVAYNVSKGALLQLKSSLAAEWATYGIRVNSISPGYMDTILNEGEGLEEARRIWTSRNPMGRMGDPSEIVGVVVMLCSRAGKYVNGVDIAIDGGGMVF